MNNQSLAPLEQVREIIGQNHRSLTMMLPTHLKEQGPAFLNAAIAACQKNDDLMRGVLQSPQTFINALSEAAQLGLRPGSAEYYLTPRKAGSVQTVLGIIGYQGEIELIYRAGAVTSVIAEVVYANDEYRYERGVDLKPVHRIKGGNFGPRSDRGELMGVYAYGIMVDGSYSRIIEHGADHIADVKKSSQGSTGQYSPWVKWPDQMWLKTAVHSLSKWVPTSAEYARQAATLASPHAPAVVGEVVADQPAEPAAQPQQPAQTQANGQQWAPPAPGGFEDMGEQLPVGVNAETGEFDPTMQPGWGK